jgi:acyl-[acyl-carrier-protein] desaturase
VHRDEVVLPLLRYWQVFELTGLPADAEVVRDELAAALGELDQRVTRLLSRRESVLA